MRNGDQIERAGNRLSSYRPELRNRDELVRKVMAATLADERKNIAGLAWKYLFAWSDRQLIRGVAISFSLALLVFFAGQQYILVNRIIDLEKRVVNINTDQIIERQANRHSAASLMISGREISSENDSITVSGDDLRSLIDSYLELQQAYDLIARKYREANPGTKSNL